MCVLNYEICTQTLLVSFSIFLDHSWLCRLVVWELNVLWAMHHKKLKSIQRASLSNELYQRQTDYICECCWYCELRSQTSCCCFLAEKGYIESHRLMYINREISFEFFLELTRVYNFSIRPHHCSVHTDNIVCVVIYHVSEVLKICSQRLCSLRICNFMHKQQLINSFKKDFKMHQKCPM